MKASFLKTFTKTQQTFHSCDCSCFKCEQIFNSLQLLVKICKFTVGDGFVSLGFKTLFHQFKQSKQCCPSLVLIFHANGAFKEAKSNRALREMGDDSNEGCVEIRSVEERKKETGTDRELECETKKTNVSKEEKMHMRTGIEKDSEYKTEKEI